MADLVMGILTFDTVNSYLRYEPEVGKLYWRERDLSAFAGLKRPPEVLAKGWNTKYANAEAFTATAGNGYKVGAINYRNYLAHRIAWLLFYRAWPVNCIDHINGNRADNRIDNLRDVTVSGNARNIRRRSDNKSGINGVCIDNSCGSWRAQIRINGVQIHLGNFADIEDAKRARERANILYGYSERHGL